MIYPAISDDDILNLADKKLVYRPVLQVAHDRMLVFSRIDNAEEYEILWQAYLRAGGDRTMQDHGIDTDNWKRVKTVLIRN